MKRRLLAMILLTCLLSGVFTGCSGDSKTNTDNPAAPTASGDNSGLKMSDVPGMTAPGVLPIVTNPVTLKLGIPQLALVMDYEDNYMTNMILKETGINVDFEFFPGAEAAQKFELMVSSNQKLPDIMNMSFTDQARASYGKNGILKPLNDYFKKYAYFYNNAKVTAEERKNIEMFGTSPDGNMYGFPAYANAYGDISMFSWFFNMEWLKKLGLQMPKTTDELYTVLKAFKEKDPNGNKKPDEIPLISSNGWNGNVHQLLINSFIHYNPTYLFNVEKGKLSVPVITEEYREALRYIRKLVKEELLSPLSFTMKQDELKRMLNLPKEQDKIVGAFGGSTVTLFESNNENPFEYEGAPALKGPKGVSWAPNRTPNYMYRASITKDCKNPEAAFRLFDYFTEEKRSLITRFGEPDVSWMYRPDDPEAFDKKFPNKRNNLDFDRLFAPIPGSLNVWSQQNKVIWNEHFCCFLPANIYSAAAAENPPVTYYGEALEKKLGVDAHKTYIAYKSYEDKVGKIPKETVTKLIYTEQENAEIAEIVTSVGTYIAESTALFCNGGLDIEKDWDTYVKNLKSIGLDQYLKTAQAAYDRMNKK